MKRLVLVALALAMVGAGCKREGGEIGAFRSALTEDGTASAFVAGGPRCVAEAAARAGGRAPDACLGEVATWFGSKNGFQYDPPDQAAAATAALLIARDAHGEWLPAPDAWLFALREGKGDGADALRLAMASRMAVAVPKVARALVLDDEARALMSAVAGSVPGACETYARLGAGDDPLAGPPEETADHSPCVQKDLERRTGPKEHGRYGSGLWRGAEGALALWKDAGAALKEGAGKAEPAVQAALEPKLAAIGEELEKVAPKRLAAPPDYSAFMSDVHGAEPADAGARRVAPGGVPAPR